GRGGAPGTAPRARRRRSPPSHGPPCGGPRSGRGVPRPRRTARGHRGRRARRDREAGPGGTPPRATADPAHAPPPRRAATPPDRPCTARLDLPPTRGDPRMATPPAPRSGEQRAASTARVVQAATWAVFAVFFLNGFNFASW